MFVIRVGDWGGYMLVECDDPTTVHKVCSLSHSRPHVSNDNPYSEAHFKTLQ